MPWCPKCGTEYRPEIDACTDCGGVLVANGPETAPSPIPKRMHPAFVVVLSVVSAIAATIAAFVVVALLWSGRIPNAASVVPLITAGLAGLFLGSQYPGRLRTIWVAVGWFVPTLPFMIGLFLPEYFEARTTIDRILDGVISFIFLVSFSAAGAVGTVLGSKPNWRRILVFAIALAVLIAYLTFALNMIDKLGHHTYR